MQFQRTQFKLPVTDTKIIDLFTSFLWNLDFYQSLLVLITIHIMIINNNIDTSTMPTTVAVLIYLHHWYSSTIEVKSSVFFFT